MLGIVRGKVEVHLCGGRGYMREERLRQGVNEETGRKKRVYSVIVSLGVHNPYYAG